MRKTILLSVVGVIALGCIAPASARDAAQPETSSSNDPGRTICVRAQITGSRLNRRICRTAREWEEEGGLPEAR